MKSLVLLIRRSVFFDILHTLSPVETSKTLAKMCFFLEATDGEHFFREMKERYKVFCVKIFFRNSVFYLKYCKPHSLLKIMKMS